MICITDLRCDYKKEPKDIGTRQPLFGFRIKTEKKDTNKWQWCVQVAENSGFDTLIWDSGWRKNNKTIAIPYQGKPLQSQTCYFWSVCVRAGESIVYEYSQFETTILSASEWHASFIAQDTPISHKCNHVIEMRKKFELDFVPTRGRLYITAQGLYRARINGKQVTDALLTPGFTTYHKNLLFQTYDVSDLLREGDNEIRVMLGYGWYGRLGSWPGQEPYASKPAALIAQMRVENADGHKMTIVSDYDWQWVPTRIVSSNIYNGEIVDGGCQEQIWRNVKEIAADKGILHPHDGELVRCAETLPAREEIHTPRGETVFDFGQNLSGFVRIRATGNKGDIIRIRHAETLDHAGCFYTENLRGAQQVFQYVFDRDGDAVIEPQFTFFGFRYICVDKFPNQASCKNFTAVAVYSNLEETLKFTCSDHRIEKLIQNTAWGMKSNIVDIPTDCPQRDERLGWTGDALAFCGTAAYFMRTPLFFEKWLHDMRENQHPDGALPNTIPDMFNNYEQVTVQNRNCYSAAGWSEVALLCPYIQYQFFGNKRILADNFDMMRAYMEYIKSRCNGNMLWEGDEQFGDWLALDAEEGSYTGATPKDYIASAFYAQANRLMADICMQLEKEKESEVYQRRFIAIRKTFIEKYFDETENLLVKTQTACVLALEFKLSPSPQKTADQLADMIHINDNHLTTGFLGTPYLCQTLFDHGYQELAVTLLLQDTYPSWLYPITKGATTIWEHWDGIKPDGTMWSEDMNSFNHYAYGSICSFIFSRIVGLQYDKNYPGFERFTIVPYFIPDWNDCSFTYRSVRGDIKLVWHRTQEQIQLCVTIPCGSYAHLVLPDGTSGYLDMGTYTYSIKQ